MTPLTGDLGKADLAVLERWADPRALLRADKAELAGLITETSNKQQGETRARQRRGAAVELYQDHPAMRFAELAAEVVTEVRARAARPAPSWLSWPASATGCPASSRPSSTMSRPQARPRPTTSRPSPARPRTPSPATAARMRPPAAAAARPVRPGTRRHPAMTWAPRTAGPV
jgi:hypothetical protein